MQRWQVQEAKAKFSSLVAGAQAGEPQAITRHGRDVAVVVSAAEYDRLRRRPTTSLLDFLSNTGLSEIELPERDRDDTGREVDL